jgi:hypothetical protein
MAVPLTLAGGAVGRRRRLAPQLLVALLALGGVLLLLVIGVLGALFGIRPFQGAAGPSPTARAEIPPAYLALYEQAGQRYGIDPWILAGIGAIETEHGQSTAPGVRSGVNAYGCCAGPMQFSVAGSPSTWDLYGVDGDHDGRKSPYDPADAISAAARYLVASGAPRDYHAALFAYNHAGWYVDEMLAKADQCRAAAPRLSSPGALGGDVAPPSVTARAILRNPRITLTATQRSDVRSGVLDPRVLASLRRSVSTTAWSSPR